MITDPGKRLGHNSPAGDTKRHRSQALVECDSSSKMALIAIHEIDPGGGINEHALDLSDRCRHDLSRHALRTDQSGRQRDPRFLRCPPGQVQ